ncbi:MAG: prepilin-type N-terminal cleavage/methylation domain-containing protein [Gammaproteobacteria bacterium]
MIYRHAQRYRQRLGFTLIELMLVILVVAL